MMVRSYNGKGIYEVNGIYICMGIRSKEIYCIGSLEKCNKYLESEV